MVPRTNRKKNTHAHTRTQRERERERMWFIGIYPSCLSFLTHGGTEQRLGRKRETHTHTHQEVMGSTPTFDK